MARILGYFFKKNEKKKAVYEFDEYQIELIVNSLYMCQKCFDIVELKKTINLIFSDREKDFSNIFYLQRIIAIKGNEQLNNLHNDIFFTRYKEKTIDKVEVV